MLEKRAVKIGGKKVVSLGTYTLKTNNSALIIPIKDLLTEDYTKLTNDNFILNLKNVAVTNNGGYNGGCYSNNEGTSMTKSFNSDTGNLSVKSSSRVRMYSSNTTRFYVESVLNFELLMIM